MPQELRPQCGFGRSRNLSSNVLITCTCCRIVYLVGAWPRERNQVGFGLVNYTPMFLAKGMCVRTCCGVACGCANWNRLALKNAVLGLVNSVTNHSVPRFLESQYVVDMRSVELDLYFIVNTYRSWCLRSERTEIICTCLKASNHMSRNKLRLLAQSRAAPRTNHHQHQEIKYKFDI
jgi:hypothetical protein